MKATVVILVALAAAVFGEDYPTECPPEQAENWEIEQLLRHEDCNMFYKCTFGKPIAYKCYGDLYFNLETWECDWPHNVDCTGRNDPATSTAAPTTEPTTTTTPTTTTPTTTTTTPTTTTTTPTTTTTTPTTTTTTPTTTTTTPTTTTTTPTTTTPTTTTTTPTTTTNATTTTTAAPECEVIVSPSPSPEPEEEVEIEFLPNGCPVDPHIHWLLPHETECRLFYYCVWGEKVQRECSSILHFNPVLQVCDWPQDAGCAVSANKHANARRAILKEILS